MQPITEARFRAMGSDCHLLVVGGPEGLIEIAQTRVLQLERRWSRFIPTSEVSTLNANPGAPVLVSDDTLALVECAVEAHRFTSGRFDATVLGDVIRAGYDRTFDQLPADPSGVSDLLRGPISVIGPTVVLATGTGFDPGGIGKGLAADIVARETMDAGATGVSVNLGGDVRVEGVAPSGDGWSVAIEYPHSDHPLTTIGIGSGGVATSTTLLRRWLSRGESRHHVIDPSTGGPAATDLTLVTVVAARAWIAETQAKACLMAGSRDWNEVTSGSGMEALAVTEDGAILSTPGLARFTKSIPVRLGSTKEGTMS